MTERIYKQIIEQLKLNHRPRITLSEKELDQLKKNIELLLSQYSFTNDAELSKKFCIINHLSRPIPELFPLIELALSTIDLNDDLKIFTAQAAQKHIIDHKVISGNRLEMSFLNSLIIFTKNSHKKNVLPWAIQLIEQCGSQSILLKDTLNSLKWNLFDAVSSKNRKTINSIDQLNQKWAKFSTK